MNYILIFYLIGVVAALVSGILYINFLNKKYNLSWEKADFSFVFIFSILSWISIALLVKGEL